MGAASVACSWAGSVRAQDADVAPATSVRWVAYYGSQARLQDFAPYDLVILDSAFFEYVPALRDQGKTVLGYLSVGEVDQHRHWKEDLRRAGLLGPANPNWPDSQLIDVRDPLWTRMVVGQLVPEILRRGFSGVFLDTLDSPADWQDRAPIANAGMKEALASLVRTVRRHFPGSQIAVNRGYSVMPGIVDHIDLLLGESVLTGFDFANRRYRLAEPEAYRWQYERLERARRANPALRIITLDYWPPDDPGVRGELYAIQRQNGYAPYVATIGLDRIVPEPGTRP